MEPSTDAISVISSIALIIKQLKSSSDDVLGNVLPFSPVRVKLVELQKNVEIAETKIDEAKVVIQQLGKLIRAYSDLISDVRIAGASADKFGEIIGLEETLLIKYKMFFVNKVRDEYTRVTSGVAKLPKPKSTEAAKKVGNLEIISRSIRDLNQKLRDQDDLSKVPEVLKNISNQYSDMESTLAELLKEILIGFDPSEG
jgi:hypothetical protein